MHKCMLTLANAIKYAPGKNILWVTSTAMDDRIQIAVKDFGVGIKKTDQDKIFNQYYRVENKMTGEICGHGLGLFIAKQLILEHGGLIWLESEENKGSTFYFTVSSASLGNRFFNTCSRSFGMAWSGRTA
jgi:two-component system sensor histidine kinase VicK